ncbi:MAG: prolyl oligopeptidase family protein [Phycisphaerae bacterium]
MKLFLPAAVLLATAMTASRSADAVEMVYPDTPRGQVIDDYHGTPVPDPYRALEDHNAPEARAFIAAQNALTRDFIPADVRDTFRARLQELVNYPRQGLPGRAGDVTFLSRNDGLQNHSVLFVRDAAGERVLIDPNTFSDDGTTALAGTWSTRDGTLLAYGVSEGGSDNKVVRFLDVATGEPVAGELTDMRFSSIAWKSAGEGFWYNRYPPNERLNNRLYWHALGSDQAQDPVVYARPDDPQIGLYPWVEETGQYLFVYESRGTDRRAGIVFRNTDAPPADGAFKRLFDIGQARYGVVAAVDGVFYVWTDQDAPNRRLVKLDPADPGQMTDVIPERDAVLESVSLAGGKLVALYQRDAASMLKVFDLDGTHETDIPLPTVGSVYGVSAEHDKPEVYFGFTSFNYPSSVFAYDVNTGETTPYFQPDVDFDPAAYEVTQAFVTSRDGTKVPVFITHKKGLKLDGTNPTILYGYGGFSVGQSPFFSTGNVAWMEAGGVFALACIRGGDEYGTAWHEAGKLEKRQNVFDDFHASARMLIDAGYTRPDKLATRGGSNGGLLVAACMLQEPELYGAVICHVGVLDMLRFHTFGTGRFWTVEYGNATESKDQFDFMIAYSPLHNVKPIKYPALLVTTGDGDDRVVPAHSLKFVAEMQHTADPAGGPYLLRYDVGVGHGAGKPLSMALDEQADIFAFLHKTLEMAK